MPDPDLDTLFGEVETLSDWNGHLLVGGCCGMPSMSAVEFECRSAVAWVDRCGEIDPKGPERLTYRTLKTTYEDGHVETVSRETCNAEKTTTCVPMSVVTTWALDPDSVPAAVDDTTTQLGDFILGDYAPKTHTRFQRTVSATYNRTFTKTYAADCKVTETYGGSASLEIHEITTVTIEADELRGVEGYVDTHTMHVSCNASWASDGTISGSKVTTWDGGDPFTEVGADCYPEGYFQAKIDVTVTPSPTHYAIEYSDLDANCGSFNPDDNWPGSTFYRVVTTTDQDTLVKTKTYKIDPDTKACVSAVECTALTITTTESLDKKPPNEEIIDPEPAEDEKSFTTGQSPVGFGFNSWGTFTKTWGDSTYTRVTTTTYGAPTAVNSETAPEAPQVGDVWKKTSTGVYYVCTAVTPAVVANPEAQPPVVGAPASAAWGIYNTCEVTEGCSGSMSYSYTTVLTVNTEWGDVPGGVTQALADRYGLPVGGTHFTTTTTVSVSGNWTWVPEIKAVDAVEADPDAFPPVEAVDAVEGVAAHCRFQGSYSIVTTSDDPGADLELGNFSYAIDQDYVPPDPMPDPPPAYVSTAVPTLPNGFTTITSVSPAPIPEKLSVYSSPIVPENLWADPVTGKQRGFWIDEAGYGTSSDVIYGSGTHFGRHCHSLYLNGTLLDQNDEILNRLYGKRRVYYRWKIPTSYTGSKVKITWDVVTEPALQAKSLVENLTWEFSGPGTGDFANSSWYSPMFTLEPPEVTGRREIVNIRFTGTPNNPHGNKPQVTGRAIELPAPPPP